MDLESRPKAEQELSPTALFELVQQMKTDFDQQRHLLEQKITKLESELSTVRQQEQSNSTTVLPKVSTSRRRLLKTLAAGAIGVAAVNLLGNAAIETAHAETFTPAPLEFNGYPGFPQPGQNSAVFTTLIKTNQTSANGKAVYNINSPEPLLTIDNDVSFTPTGTAPANLPLALYARSNSSHAIYGYSAVTSGIVGLSQNTSLPATNFFASMVGGVVGYSNAAKGVVGMSISQEGVAGLSSTNAAVYGVSETGYGASFGVEVATNTGTGPGGGLANDQGAAIRLGLRNSSGAPSGTTYPHNTGEIVLDKFARIFVCTTTRVAATPKPETDVPQGAFYKGATSATAASWRQMPHMFIKNGAPPIGQGYTGDSELHSRGELWLDPTTGNLFSCVTPGSTDSSLLASIGLPTTQKAIFRPAANGLVFLPYPDRWLDTYLGIGLTGGVSGRDTAWTPVEKQRYDVQIAGVEGDKSKKAGPNGTPSGETLLPNGIQAVFGTVTVQKGISAITNAGLVKILPGGFADPVGKGTSTGVFRNNGDFFAPVFIKLNAAGQLSFTFINGTLFPSDQASKLQLDIVAYIP